MRCIRIYHTAEKAGFEPAIPFRGIHAFQSCLFNHSSISPSGEIGQQRYKKILICNTPAE